ncbi:MFS transporter [Frigidibacter mobilis]|uniref:Major facilitator superfamily MFS 1 n=1 Tax=Frigidibacter mobilis TaxID=1335048 RepID=A0A159Z1K8_9RHOB|nr:MFS transporter [Frigidibacter mobilis]AMY68832.1 major facilitator superfamily MFS 1 [Frigidibacter mobilis]
MRAFLPILGLLALTQITGWGSVGVLPVLAPAIAAEFGVALPTVFLGSSLMFVAIGIASPLAGRAFRRFGPREGMATGAGLIGLSLCVVALAPGLPVFCLGWALVGLGGSLFLTTAAYAYLAEYAQDRARSLIGTLMLVTGLSGAVFLPLTAWLAHMGGWREAVLTLAAVMVLGVCPLVRFGLPRTGTAATALPRKAPKTGRILTLLVAAIALNSFVTFGIEAVGITLLQASGADLATAVAIASALGVCKVGGRLLDLAGGQRWDGLSTALASGLMIPLGLAALWLGGAGLAGVAGYLLLFGIGSGAFAVARATMPLVFYARADYAAAMAGIALPMNLINALAPPVLAALLTGLGPRAVLAVLGALSLSAFAVLLQLNRLRDHAGAGAG